MPFQARITVTPDHGRFQPDSFAELLQAHIELPGLDPSWTHTLTDVQVADDGGHAELTVHSEPPAALPLHASIRVVTTTPPARVRVVDQGGTVLHEGEHPAPLRLGQTVDITGGRYLVADVAWPGRHPETGACAGDLDWQVATVLTLPQVAAHPVAVTA